ncbi:GntR family transcriptional regulator [Brachybacterium sp. AOP43-C2-M15]|uniref:GntR family transcriptional regulator n=1 Tax=Brachybacterium sp. AOP43-C2-M15 TaxID=3457661 RepID=UPI004033F5BD
MADRSKFRTLLDDLRRQIEAMPVGTAVPSERALAAEAGVSRMTARRALDELTREGRLVREVGRGSFVARPAVTLPLHLTGFTEDMASRGITATSRVLRLAEEPADAASAEHLGLVEGAAVIRLDRVRLADGRPMAIERTTLDASMVPGLADVDFADRSLYRELEHRYGVLFDAGEQTIRAAIVQPEDVAALGVDEGSAVLEFVRVSGCGGRLVERTVSTYPGDRFELSARIAPVTAPGSGGRSALRARR